MSIELIDDLRDGIDVHLTPLTERSQHPPRKQSHSNQARSGSCPFRAKVCFNRTLDLI